MNDKLDYRWHLVAGAFGLSAAVAAGGALTFVFRAACGAVDHRKPQPPDRLLTAPMRADDAGEFRRNRAAARSGSIGVTPPRPRCSR
jgi:hypothetical protein